MCLIFSGSQPQKELLRSLVRFAVSTREWPGQCSGEGLHEHRSTIAKRRATTRNGVLQTGSIRAEEVRSLMPHSDRRRQEAMRRAAA
eukprot:646129-Pleurochrysis_carterae.AAC.2